jgi:prepilin-type processing-associated H-X9-DG protein
MVAETVQGQGSASGVTVNGVANQTDIRGLIIWGDAAGFETVIGPNSTFPDVIYVSTHCAYPYQTNPPCVYQGGTYAQTWFGARGRHPGGVNVSMCDGSVKFVKNSIAINIWRALSTTQGAEVISSDAF